MRDSEANKKEFLNSIYEDYKEACDIVIEEIKKHRKGLPADDDLIRACAVFYVLGSQEAKKQGFTDIKLEDYISDFIPSIGAIIENSIATRPKNYLLLNHKEFNSLFKAKTNAFIVDVNPSEKTAILIDFDDSDVTYSKDIEQFDKSVFRAVCTLYEAGNKAFTPAMVYRSMTAQDNNKTISPTALKLVQDSLNKQKSTNVKISRAKELEAFGCDINNISWESEGYLLPLEKEILTINGQKVEAYTFSKIPKLYERCKSTKQIITVPACLLDTNTRNSKELITVKEYLLVQIENIKNKYRNNKKILYETIFAECGIEIKKSDRNKKKRYIDSIKQMLEAWTEKGYIKAYKEYRRGSSFAGVEIIF